MVLPDLVVDPPEQLPIGVGLQLTDALGGTRRGGP